MQPNSVRPHTSLYYDLQFIVCVHLSPVRARHACCNRVVISCIFISGWCWKYVARRGLVVSNTVSCCQTNGAPSNFIGCFVWCRPDGMDYILKRKYTLLLTAGPSRLSVTTPDSRCQPGWFFFNENWRTDCNIFFLLERAENIDQNKNFMT